MPEPKKTKSSALRALPSVDELIRLQDRELLAELGTVRVTAFARHVIDDMRQQILRQKSDGGMNDSEETLLASALERLQSICRADKLAGVRRVINATGVILHTNLGRAPLSAAACYAVAHNAAGYCTLEYDTNSGTRGRRGERVENLLKQLTGAEDALVVNNCAAAALLIVTAFAKGGETIVSRGELVEIGGDFRVPDVLANSGTQMIEVGTTNRTKLEDYRRAINERTRLIIRVHPSNYRIIGFTSSPTLVELASIARESGIRLYEDAGSGVLQDLSKQGLGDEPVIRNCIAEGADVVSFSGDKLLGSAQAGLIVGRSNVVERLRKHSMYRALRADKLSLAALEATLEAYVRGTATSEIPTLKMLSTPLQEIKARAEKLLHALNESALSAELVEGESAIGGGSGPNTHPPTMLIALSHDNLTAAEIEDRLRQFSPPIIARIGENKVLIDLRTVDYESEDELLSALKSLGC